MTHNSRPYLWETHERYSVPAKSGNARCIAVLLCCIFVAENSMKDNLKELMQATCLIFKCVRVYLKAEGSHCEPSL